MGARILNQGLDQRVLSLQQYIQNGLKRDQDVHTNDPFCEHCKGLMAAGIGMYPPDLAVNPTDLTPTFAWPVPQLWRGKDTSLVFTNGGLFTSAEGSGTWTTTAETVYDITDPTTSTTISTDGDTWQVADFHGVWFATNGTELIVKTPNFSNFNAMLATDPVFQAVGASNNRWYAGGIAHGAGVWFDSAQWTAFFNAWKDRGSEGEITYDDQAMGANWVMFSEIAGGQISWPFITMLSALSFSTSADFDLIREDIIQSVETGQMGIIQMPWQGSVYAIKQLGQYTIVYGNSLGGITALTADHQKIPIADVGLDFRGAVVSRDDMTEHLFVDALGQVWKLNSQLQLTQLTKQGALILSTSEQTVCAYDPIKEVYWISDGIRSYAFSDTGLSEHYTFMTGIMRSGSGLVGYSDSNFPDETAEILTNGGFTGNANDWTLGTGWAYNSNNVTHTAGNTADMSQAVGDMVSTPIQGRLHKISVTLSSVTAGSVSIRLSTVAESASNTLEASANGTFTKIVRASAVPGLVVTPTSAFDGTLDDISVVEVDAELDFETLPFDSGVQGIDTIDRIQIITKPISSTFNVSDLDVVVLAAYEDESAFLDHDLGNPDGRGIVRANISGSRFKLRITGTSSNARVTMLKDITVSFRSGGKSDLKNRLSRTAP